MNHCRWLLLVAVVLATLVAGCRKSDHLPVYPVRGVVRVDGQPAAYAALMLHPVGGDEAIAQLRPFAKADVNGEFQLCTYARGDGAPAGQYKVTLVWRGPEPGVDPNDIPPEELTSGPDRLQGRFDDETTTPLTATILAGDNQLPLEVKLR